MANWCYFVCTVAAIAVVIVFVIAVRFFRKLYFMVEEIDARLIQMRNIIQPPPSKNNNGAGPSVG